MSIRGEKMQKQISVIMVLLFIVSIGSLLAGTACAQVSFYTGDVVISSLDASIDIQEKANVNLNYVLKNEGAAECEVSLTFPSEATVLMDGKEFSNPVIFKPGESKTFSLSYEKEVKGEKLRVFTFDPFILFDDMPNSKRVRSYSVKVMLPEGINRLVTSNKKYDLKTLENGRATYLWSKKNIYLTSLMIKWSIIDVDLAVEKTVTPNEITAPDQIVNIKITIENKGNKEVKSITLMDNFFPADIEAVSPLEEFTMQGGPEEEPRLIWCKKVESLMPKEIKNYQYSIKIKRLFNTTLDPLTVIVEGSLVSVSNEVNIEAVSQLPPSPTPTPKPIPSFLPIALVIVVILAVITVLALLLRRRKREE